jgi:hypothetical protein
MKGALVAPKMDFMRLRYESNTNDDLRGDFHRDDLLNLGDLICLVCLILDTYVGMISPALGSAVLHWGADVALTTSVLWKSNLGLTFDARLASGLMPGAPKVQM